VVLFLVARFFLGGHVDFFGAFTWFSSFKVCFSVFSSQEATKALKEDLDNVRRDMDTVVLQVGEFDRNDFLLSPFFLTLRHPYLSLVLSSPFFTILFQPNLSPILAGRGKH
jgi:hypothetical protein